MGTVRHYPLHLLSLGLLWVTVAVAQQAFASATTQSIADKQALRLVVLAPHSVELLFAIGAGEQIIGTTEYADYPETARAITRVGNAAGLQVEKIVQMQPDVVIAWQQGSPASDIARLQRFGMTIEYTHPRTLDDVAHEVRKLGVLTGREPQAQHLAQQYQQRLAQLREQYAQAMPIRVFYELWSHPLRTVAGTAWPQQQLALCGAKNPFAQARDDYPLVSLEAVLAQAPQVIIQPIDHSQGRPDRIDWAQWPQIPAVKHGLIVQPDADRVHRMTLRMLDETAWLCQQLDQARQLYRKRP